MPTSKMDGALILQILVIFFVLGSVLVFMAKKGGSGRKHSASTINDSYDHISKLAKLGQVLGKVRKERMFLQIRLQL